MKHRLSVGLIGLGGMGYSHLQTLRQLEAQGRLHLAAVADPMAEKLAYQIADLKVAGVRWYPAYESMLNNEDLDAVVIATPIFLHADMARKCLERGLYVYLEKPPVPLIQQLEELIKIDQEKRVRLVFQMINSEIILKLKQAVIEGKLGKIQEMRISACWPRRDSYYNRNKWVGKMMVGEHPVFDGPATNALAHLIHNAMFLAGDSMAGFGALEEIQAELYRVRPIESYDLICFRGRFPSGINITAALTHATEELRPFRFKIKGTKGWAEISKDGMLMESSFGTLFCEQPFETAFRRSYESFFDIMEGCPSRPLTCLKDSRGYVKATNGAMLSSGEIFTVDTAFSRIYNENSDQGYDVPGLADLIDRTYHEGLLFSECGVPWAHTTPTVAIQKLTSLDLQNLISQP